MALDPGTRFGSYEIADAIGSGGMGEVYRAKDTTLERDVAIKVLPESFASDDDRIARFEQEAKTLASLNHANIAQVFGLEKSDDSTAIVMELVEGPTLADRIADGPIPADEALNIAMQIADALEAAHEQGIVHRDLKPANIKLRTDGAVKVLDFGIAKALETHTGISGPLAPSLTTPAMTMAGVILGTAAYMSPEQARGKFVDRRTDIWAFGCVLYEMLTGQPAFGGEDITITLARVAIDSTDFDTLPKGIPPAVKHTIKLCLEKDPARRISDIRDVRLALEGVFEADVPQDADGAVVLPIWRRVLLPTATLVIGGVVAGVAVWLSTLPAPEPVNRFDHELAEGQTFRAGGRQVMAVAPDGRHFVYNTGAGLYLRPLGEREARLIAGTEEGLARPFFSADGQSIGYFSFDGRLKRIAISGGAPVVISNAPDNLFGASWGMDGTIVFGSAGGIYQVPASGGEPQLIVEAQGNEDLHGPEVLPDGDSLLFTVSTIANDWDSAQIVVQSLSTGERKVLIQGGSDARYMPTGHLVYALSDGLFAQVFDLDSLEVSGGAVPLVQGVLRAGRTGAANYGVSNDGTLVYVTGTSSGGRTPVWIDRNGREETIAIELGEYAMVRISPDAEGTRIALDDRGAADSIWIYTIATETRIPLSIGTGASYPVWSPDGLRIAYSTGTGDIAWKASNNTGIPETLAEQISDGSANVDPYFFSPSGAELVFRNQSNNQDDIGMISVDGDAEPVALLNGPYFERNAELSPDGRWMAYQSNESGEAEVYVRPFPNVDDNQIPISNNGGRLPLWSRDGRELFYVETGPTRQTPRLMSVAIEETSGSEFLFGDRTPIFDYPYPGVFGGAPDPRPYDVSPDGRRFLVLTDAGGSGGGTAQIIIVQNWFEELKRLAPVD